MTASLRQSMSGLGSRFPSFGLLSPRRRFGLGQSSHLAQHAHQFADLLSLLITVAGTDGPFNAMRDVVLQRLVLDTFKRGADGRDLGDDVDTIALVLDHSAEAAHLSLDSAKALQASSLGVFPHACNIPMQGICDKSLNIPVRGMSSVRRRAQWNLGTSITG